MTVSTGDQVHVYSGADGAVLQLRRSVPTTSDTAATSFKVGVALSAAEMLELAGELLTVASSMVRKPKPEKTPATAAGVSAETK
jgi:hypothetical protein